MADENLREALADTDWRGVGFFLWDCMCWLLTFALAFAVAALLIHFVPHAVAFLVAFLAANALVRFGDRRFFS